jgi:hypothetical protein
MKRVLLLLALAVLVTAAPARAQTLQTPTSPLGEAAQAIRDGDSVYVHPDARDVLSEADARQVEQSIADEGGRIFVAVLPEGGADAALQLGNRVRVAGTYVTLADGTWSAASNQLDRGEATELIRDARAEGSPKDVLDAFVAGVGESRDGGSGTGLLAVLGALAAGGGLLAWRSARRRRAREAEELEDLRRTASDDLNALGEDVRLLEIDVDMPGADPRAKERYNEAVQAYVRAEEALDLARRPEDFRPIGEALEEGRWDMAAAKAHLAGRDEPERRPPCFFDPRHGPSVGEVEWQPEWGEPRAVPVCAADAARLEAGEEPMSREVVVGGQRMPYWQAPGHYAPFYAGGMFGGFGGFLPGLLFGSMLGGGWGIPMGGDAGGGSDWGGGDFGGGDFGGGDFGGGDFGG